MPRLYVKRKFKRSNKRGMTTAKVKRIIQGQAENKFLDATITETPVLGTSTIVALTACAQGTDNNRRIGDCISIKSIQIRGQIYADSDAVRTDLIRVILVHSRNNEGGSVPAILDLLTNDNPVALRDIDHDGEYKIFYGKLSTLPTDGTTIQKAKVFKYYKRFNKPMKAFFDDVEAVDFTTGHWFLVFMSNAGQDSQPTFTFRTRITYTDL